MKRELWRQLAKCNGRRDVNFFSDEKKEIEQAKAVCATCPVQLQCRIAGTGEKFGVWGGESPADRKRSSKEAISA